MVETRAGWGIACALAAALLGCGDPGPPTAGDPECSHLGWRDPMPDAVVCPGTDDCLCSDGEICCVAQDEEVGIVAARCTPAGDCTETPIRCDGPEDCAGEHVCCFREGTDDGGACVPPAECTGDSDLTLCRADADCAPDRSCVPAEPGTYFDAAAAFCRG